MRHIKNRVLWEMRYEYFDAKNYAFTGLFDKKNGIGNLIEVA